VTPDKLTTRNEKKNSSRSLFLKIPPDFRNDLTILTQMDLVISNWTKAKEIWAPILAVWNECHDLMKKQNVIKKANNFSKTRKEKKRFALSADEEDSFDSSDIDELERDNDNDKSTELIYGNSYSNSIDKHTINKEKAISISNKNDEGFARMSWRQNYHDTSKARTSSGQSPDNQKNSTINNLKNDFNNDFEFIEIMDTDIDENIADKNDEKIRNVPDINKEYEKVITSTNNGHSKNDNMDPNNCEIRFLDNNDNGVFYIIDNSEILFTFKTLYSLLGVNSLGFVSILINKKLNNLEKVLKKKKVQYSPNIQQEVVCQKKSQIFELYLIIKKLFGNPYRTHVFIL
jgi:hypothetical protein